MTDPELMARLAAIEDRLSALERGGRAPHPSPADAAPLQPAHVKFAPPPPPPPVERVTVPTTSEVREAPTASAPLESLPAVPRFEQAPPSTPSAPAEQNSSQPIDLERFLGVQAAAWIGAIVVIAAIGIFAKFAIDQGWFQKTPPGAKLALAYALSAAFIVAGTLLRERIGRLPSASMLAAGIGGLFVSTCAGITPLNVLGPVGALLAGVASAIVAGALTLRSRELAVGAIGILGAYIVPVFAEIYTPQSRLGDDALVTGALYLSGVYAVALALARLGPPDFAWLRLSGAFQAISAVVLLLQVGGGSPTISIAFTALWWAMAVSECTLAAMRGATPRFNTAVTVSATSIGATLALRGAFGTNPWADIQSWLPLGMAMAAGAGAVYLRGLVPAGGTDDRDRDEDPEAHSIASACARQSTVLAVLAGALVIAQVGVVVRGGALPVTWAVMGAAAIFIGRRNGQMATARLGVASAMLGLLATAVHALSALFGSTTLFEYPSDPSLRSISAWDFRFVDGHWTPLIVAFATLFAARFWSAGTDRERRAPLTSGFLAACASLLWIGFALSTRFSYTTVLLLLAIPVAAMLAGRTLSLIKLIGLLGSVIAALAWFVSTLLHVSENQGSTDARPSGGAIAAAFVVAGFLSLGRRFRAEKFGEIPTAIGFGFGLAALATLILVERLAGPGDGDLQMASTWAAIAVAVVATISAVTARKANLQLSASLGLVATGLACGVILFAAIANAMNPTSDAQWIWHWLLTPVNLALVALAACGLVIRGTFADEAAARDSTAFCAAAGFLIGSATLVYRFFDPRVGAPFETTRVIQQSALSVWLAIAAVLFVIYGFKYATRGARWTGLALLGLVAAKVLVLDMAGAATIWRVVALLATGLLLVATSAVYTRAAKATAKASPPPPPPTLPR
jgi:hypothetical protein